MVKHTQTNYLNVFDHFVGLALKGLTATEMLMPSVFRHTLGTVLIFFYSAFSFKKTEGQYLIYTFNIDTDVGEAGLR